jgi:hypothetical protein
MNSNVKPSIVKIEGDDLKQLVDEVKETLLTRNDSDLASSKKTFSIVDLWNCQRSLKTAISMRRN